MGDVVNLNKFRKKKAKDKAERDARSNRVKYGRSGDTKKLDKKTREKSDTKLDGKKLDSEDPET